MCEGQNERVSKREMMGGRKGGGKTFIDGKIPGGEIFSQIVLSFNE